MKGIFLLLGSNVGDSKRLLKEAREMIISDIGEIIRASGIYQTQAWGVEDQPDYLNQVLEIESGLSPETMLDRINSIEKSLGRIRYQKWHMRSIDIDILYYGDQLIQSERLIIPHAHIQNRQFVLVPMNEIDPDFMHPLLNKTQKELLETCPDTLGAKRIKE